MPKTAGLLSLLLMTGLGTTALGAPPLVAAAASDSVSADSRDGGADDDLAGPLESKRRALRQQALTELLNGTGTVEKRGPSTVMRVSRTRAPAAVDARGSLRRRSSSRDQYVELSREKTDRIFVVLAEFGNQRDPRFPDVDIEPSTPGPVTWDGPLHNQIPEPDRATDNSTNWRSDYSRSYFENLYFGAGGRGGSGRAPESVRQYYERQSSGRYSIDGTVTNWVKVPYNEARYGRSSDDPTTNGDDPNVCSSNVCATSYDLVRDAVQRWYDDQLAAGRTKADVTAELATFDQWDRYDVDGDGNFNEPDGYLDHFQIVHAGGDESDADPIQGEDAIWSHRSYTYPQDIGSTGPEGAKLGGTPIGDTGLWVGDYTMQPENGGMSVFAHEYGHDLGLPDLYDTVAPTSKQENGVGWWSLMSQSRESARRDQAIGTRASDFGAWEKLQLGWLSHATVRAGETRRLALGPHEYNTSRPQAAVVVLPPKSVSTDLGAPADGTRQWWSGQGDDYSAAMTRQVALGAGPATLSMKARWNIEDCGADPCDYAYVEVDDGSGWVAIPGSITQADEGNGIDGLQEDYVDATFDLSAYAGKTVGLRVRYATDGAAQGTDPSRPSGIFLDDVTVTSGGTTVFSSGAESSPEGWTLDGFSAVGASKTAQYDNYYLASNRTYRSFDAYLRSGPYNAGWPTTRPKRVEHFPYQNGLLVSYWDTSQADNNTSAHPGEGLILPVDAHPRPLVKRDGTLWRPRVASYDSPFGLERTDRLRLHSDGVADPVAGRPGNPLFRDRRSYWNEDQPTASVKVPHTGTSIRVLRQRGAGMRVLVSTR